MGSSWIVILFFFVPVSARSVASLLVPPYRGVLRGLSGTTSTTTPNERPQKNSSNLSLPVAYYQSPRQSQIGLARPVCAPWTPGRRVLLLLPLVLLVLFRGSLLPRFRITQPYRRTYVCNILYTYEAPGPHLQVRLSTAGLTRDVRTFLPAAERENRWKKVPLYDVDSFSLSAPTRYENSCRGASARTRIARICNGYARNTEWRRLIVKIHYGAREYQLHVLRSSFLLFFFFQWH